MNVLVIHEYDDEDGQSSVIGVASSVEESWNIINEYYRTYRKENYRDIRDSDLEYSINILTDFGSYKVTTQWFKLNEV